MCIGKDERWFIRVASDDGVRGTGSRYNTVSKMFREVGGDSESTSNKSKGFDLGGISHIGTQSWSIVAHMSPTEFILMSVEVMVDHPFDRLTNFVAVT